jgi:hypothetical protein
MEKYGTEMWTMMASRVPTAAKDPKHSATIGNTVARERKPFPSRPGSRALTTPTDNNSGKQRAYMKDGHENTKPLNMIPSRQSRATYEP